MGRLYFDQNLKLAFDPVDFVLTDGASPITDIDGNVYTTVIIGSQEWMVENLRTTRYADGTSISHQPTSVFDDWFLPSKEEVKAMYNELKLYNVGGLSGSYWGSTEGSQYPMGYAYSMNFENGVESPDTAKSGLSKVRACRSFTGTTGLYDIRDIGPAGGYIFAYTGGTYYESAPNDSAANTTWSNVQDQSCGSSGTSIGSGIINTTIIMSQVGHTSSAAKICSDATFGGWVNNTDGAYCLYNNDINNKALYGALYNCYAVKNAHGLAPTGWRIPSSTDFDTLITNAGGAGSAGGKLKETGTTRWASPNTSATNEYGWTAVGNGARNSAGTFLSLQSIGYLWTTTAYDAFSNRHYTPFSSTATFQNGYSAFVLGCAVRCMRDI